MGFSIKYIYFGLGFPFFILGFLNILFTHLLKREIFEKKMLPSFVVMTSGIVAMILSKFFL